MRERVVCQLRIKNEHRFIFRCLESAWAVAENVVIFDDGSTDGSDIEAARACLHQELPETGLPPGAVKVPWGWRLENTVGQVRTLHYLYSPFSEPVRPHQRINEIRDKQILLEYLKANIEADIVLCLDGDEVLSNDAIRHFDKAIAQLEEFHYLELPVIYLWDREDQIRVDGIYASPQHPRIFTIKHLDDAQLFGLRYGWSAAGGGFHCGSVPKDGLPDKKAVFRYPIIHYGYIDAELRNKKYQFYTRIDPGNKNEGQYRHIIGERDHLCPDPVRLRPWIDAAPLAVPAPPEIRPLAIIVPSRTDKLVGALLETLNSSQSEPADYQVIIADNGLSEEFRDWCREYIRSNPETQFVPVPEPFNFSRAINSCAAVAKPNADLLILNDDVVVRSVDFVTGMQRGLQQARQNGFGIISPVIDGGVGNEEQGITPPSHKIQLTRRPICFVAAAIPREVWDKTGPMDERFIGYGFEDVDYCRRVTDAGLHLGISGAGRVRHGSDSIPFSTTFRQHSDLDELSRLSGRIYAEKWGGGNQLGEYENGPPAAVLSDSPRPPGNLLEDLRSHPAPNHILNAGVDSDIESDLNSLWAAVQLCQPALAVEIGTRVGGPSTRTIADALKGGRRRFVAVETSATYTARRRPLGGCQFVQSEGQAFLASLTEQIGFLFIDVDPHGYEDTLMWLDWTERLLARGGVAAFHDIVENRAEIQVRQAVRDWLVNKHGWDWIEVDPAPGHYRCQQGGLGILRRH